MHPYLLRAPFALIPDVVQYQIVHRPDRLLVRVVPRRQSPSGLVETVTAAVRVAVVDAGAAIDVSVTAVDRIERESGHAAKVKLVVSEVPKSLDGASPMPGCPFPVPPLPTPSGGVR